MMVQNTLLCVVSKWPPEVIPNHSHKWEHEAFILNGECLVVCGDQRKKVSPGYVVFIPPNVMHHFRNEGTEVLRFLCLVPHHE